MVEGQPIPISVLLGILHTGYTGGIQEWSYLAFDQIATIISRECRLFMFRRDVEEMPRSKRSQT